MDKIRKMKVQTDITREFLPKSLITKDIHAVKFSRADTMNTIVAAM
jgi:hypothetical protein